MCALVALYTETSLPAYDITHPVCAHAKSLQSCLTLCNPRDCRLPGSSAHGILQTGLLGWVAMHPLQGFFPTKGLNPCLLYWQAGSLSLAPPGKPIIYRCAVLLLSCSVMSNSLCPMDYSPPGSSVHGDSPGKNTKVGCHTLLQGIFPTQGSNPGLLHYRHILYHLSHQGSSRMLGVGSPSLLPGIFLTWVSCIACRFFTS